MSASIGCGHWAGTRRGLMANKKPGNEAGLSGSANISAEQTGRIDDTSGRQ